MVRTGLLGDLRSLTFGWWPTVTKELYVGMLLSEQISCFRLVITWL